MPLIIRISLSVLAAALLFIEPVHASNHDNDCGSGAEQILKALYPRAEKTGSNYTVGSASVTISANHHLGDPYTMICRQWPAYPRFLLVALPLLKEQGEGRAVGDIEVAVLNHDNFKPVARLRLVNILDEDAFSLNQLDLDTAAYRLFDDRLAFGLRMSRKGSSSVNPFEQTSLWLFDMNGSSLHPVLKSLEVARYGGETDGNCNGHFEDIGRTLVIDKEKNNGAANIMVTTRTKKTGAFTNKEGQCDSIDNGKDISRSLLRYDGHRYIVPGGMQSIR